MKRILELIKKYELEILFILIICMCIYSVYIKNTDISIKNRQKEERINNIETRLEEQEKYMHDVQADIDNLKED